MNINRNETADTRPQQPYSAQVDNQTTT